MVTTVSNEKTILDYATKFAQMGLYTFPLWGNIGGRCGCGKSDCISPCKHPHRFASRGGFKNATTDFKKLKRWFGNGEVLNIGIATGEKSGIVVLDVDGETGEKSLKLFTDRYGELPVTPRTETGKGKHFLFKHPGGYVKGSVGQLAQGLDIRGDGNYIVAPPSIHISGKAYKWIVGLDTPLAPLPDWILKEQLTDVKDVKEVKEVIDVNEGIKVKVRLRLGDLSEESIKNIDDNINKTLPKACGQKYDMVWTCCRHLLGIAELKGKSWEEVMDLNIAERYHERGLPFIEHKSLIVTKARFKNAWDNVKYPVGDGKSLEIAWERALNSNMPMPLEKYEKDEFFKLLIRLNFELQMLAGTEPWFIPTRKAKPLFGFSYTYLANALGELCNDRIIEKVQKHTAYRCARYRYIA